MTENLSNTKRKYIENWRQSVSAHMENGNICRVTIAEMTPEPGPEGKKKPSPEHTRALADINSRNENASPSLPSVKFSYCHGSEDAKKKQTSRPKTQQEKHNEKYNSKDKTNMYARTLLPPSPNGCIVQNGVDVYVPKRKSSSMMKSVETVTPKDELPNVNESKENTRNSSKIAREIYDKYNMKSKTQSMLQRTRSVNGHDQYTMPWRNKTFLSLPMRFNGTLQKNNKLDRGKTFHHHNQVSYEMGEAEEDMKFIRDWEDVIYL